MEGSGCRNRSLLAVIAEPGDRGLASKEMPSLKARGSSCGRIEMFFCIAEDIEEGQPDEFDIFLFDEGDHIFLRMT